VIMINICVVWT